jgi:hypothetical protein
LMKSSPRTKISNPGRPARPVWTTLAPPTSGFHVRQWQRRLPGNMLSAKAGGFVPSIRYGRYMPGVLPCAQALSRNPVKGGALSALLPADRRITAAPPYGRTSLRPTPPPPNPGGFAPKTQRHPTACPGAPPAHRTAASRYAACPQSGVCPTFLIG